MDLKKAPALKLCLNELVEGKYFKSGNKFEPGFVVSKHGFQAFKANVWGNVIRTYVNPEATLAIIELDDFSDVMQLFFFNENALMADGIKEGMRVEAIGRLRMDRNDEIGLVPELIQEISPERELLKRLENIKSLRELKPLSEAELAGLKEEKAENKIEAPKEEAGEELVVEKNFVELNEKNKELERFKNKLEDLL